jgi:hypothetical protein
LIDEGPLLQERFSELLSWERIKRREKIVVSVFFYSLLASLVLLPANGLLPSWVNPLFLPLLFFLILAPGIFLLRPWGARESLRTLLLVDRTLHLEERAVTSWEILSRKERKAAELLVLEEAAERLREIDPRALFKRQYSWHALFAPPLLLFWLLLVWFGIGVHSERGVKGALPLSLAQKLKEFADEIQERAKSDKLTESLKIARALEEVAEKGLRGGMSEKNLREDLTGMVNQIADAGQAATEESDISFATATREGLSGLRAELDTLKHTLGFSDSAGLEGKVGPEISRRLATLPRLSEEVEKRLYSTEKLGGKELDRFLGRLDRDLGAELDRRTLQEIAEFLSLLLRGGQGQETQEAHQAPFRAGQDSLPAEKTQGKGSFPGDQPGTKGQAPESPPPFKAQAAIHLKGLLGEGKSGSLTFRGEASGGKSKITPEEILTNYRRQAEEEIASERIPESLKETIKSYFLSLGMTENKK